MSNKRFSTQLLDISKTIVLFSIIMSRFAFDFRIGCVTDLCDLLLMKTRDSCGTGRRRNQRGFNSVDQCCPLVATRWKGLLTSESMKNSAVVWSFDAIALSMTDQQICSC